MNKFSMFRDASMLLWNRIIGPNFATYITSVKKTVWFWGILLGVYLESTSK